MYRRLFSVIRRRTVCDAIAKYSSTRPGLVRTPHCSSNQNEARKYAPRKLSISTDLSTDRKLLRMAPTCNANVVSSPFPPLPKQVTSIFPCQNLHHNDGKMLQSKTKWLSLMAPQDSKGHSANMITSCAHLELF